MPLYSAKIVFNVYCLFLLCFLAGFLSSCQQSVIVISSSSTTSPTLLKKSTFAQTTFSETSSVVNISNSNFKNNLTPKSNWQQLHKDALVMDAHADTIQTVLAGRDLQARQPKGHLDIPRMREGGLDATFWAVFVDSIYQGEAATRRTTALIEKIRQVCDQYPQDLQLVDSAAAVDATVASGKIAVLMGIEGGQAINNDLKNLAQFYHAGVRYLGLTWSNTNDWADAAGDVARHNGLTDFGRQVVKEMNRLGMLVDVSHVSDKTFYDVLAVATKPVIASHSSCRALTNHPRNMTDDMLRALAKQGGVCCINFYSLFIDEAYRQRNVRYPKPGAAIPPQANLDDWAARRFQRFLQTTKNPAPPLKSLIDHLDHAVKVAGIDHVGLGSDFDGVDSLPMGMQDAAQLPQITRELAARGYSASDIRKILGGNLMRVLRQATTAVRRDPKLAPAQTK